MYHITLDILVHFKKEKKTENSSTADISKYIKGSFSWSLELEINAAKRLDRNCLYTNKNISLKCVFSCDVRDSFENIKNKVVTLC